ncbi:hypothetical protein [Effusibacillus lacus]|nr:hypothetical protein [Effusibacillus lacus]TCS74649.1 hypothetical protein EDD64_11299 [Effusibacillus lacus]
MAKQEQGTNLREESEMEYTCYYCEHKTDKVHHVTLYEKDREHDELLCPECYSEWLASLKG